MKRVLAVGPWTSLDLISKENIVLFCFRHMQNDNRNMNR